MARYEPKIWVDTPACKGRQAYQLNSCAKSEQRYACVHARLLGAGAGLTYGTHGKHPASFIPPQLNMGMACMIT